MRHVTYIPEQSRPYMKDAESHKKLISDHTERHLLHMGMCERNEDTWKTECSGPGNTLDIREMHDKCFDRKS